MSAATGPGCLCRDTDPRIQQKNNDLRLLALVGCIDGLVLELDEHTRYLDVWADDPTLLVAPRDQMIGKTVVELLGPEIGEAFAALVRRVHATGEGTRFEYPTKIGGQDRWFVADCKRVEVANGHTVVLFCRDNTERKAAEEALRVSEERYRLAARATNDVLYDCRIATGEITWGPSASCVFRDAAIAPTRDWWTSRMHPDDAARVLDSLSRALDANEESWSGGYRFRRGDGTYADVLDRAFILRTEGRPSRIVGSMADVSELNRLQAQLVHSDRLAALGTLAAGVGHEINNPLTYVIGNLDIALAAQGLVANESEAMEALRDARDGAGRIVEIVRTLKLFSRDDATVERGVQLRAVVEKSLKMAKNEIRHRARLVTAFQPVPNLRVSESRLGQVCLNLVVNAAQAITKGGVEENEIRVATGIDARGNAFLTVSDTGAGISPEHIERVFAPFFTTKPVGVGTGIGLSVCMNIVQSMGGELTVASVPGEGTTFTVSLPIDEAAPASPRRPPVVTVAAGPARPRLLVVDDEPALARLIERLMKSECDVTTAENGAIALAKIEAGARFDVILCDVMMPVMTGIGFYNALLERYPAVVPRVHFMSGGVFTDAGRRFLDALPNPALEKPMNKTQLQTLVRGAYKALLAA